MSFNRKIVLFTCAFTIFNSKICAKATLSETTKLNFIDPIIISGARQEQKLLDAVISVSVINKSEIKRSGAKSIGDLLKGKAGIEIGQSGGLGSLTSFFIRGADSRNTLVFIDGVRVRDALTQSSLAENIPLALVNKIEIVRGNVSALYGDGAIGGVINIFTDSALIKGSSQPNTFKSLSAEYGSFNTFDTNASLYGTTTEKLNFSIGFQNIKTDGFSATDPSITGSYDPTDSDKDGYKNTALSASLKKDFLAYIKMKLYLIFLLHFLTCYKNSYP